MFYTNHPSNGSTLSLGHTTPFQSMYETNKLPLTTYIPKQYCMCFTYNHPYKSSDTGNRVGRQLIGRSSAGYLATRSKW